MLYEVITGVIGFLKNNTGTISLENIFDSSSTAHSIGTITSTIVNLNNAYYINGVVPVESGVTTGSFSKISITDLETKSYVLNNLSFNEYIDFNDLEINDENVWVYEKESSYNFV